MLSLIKIRNRKEEFQFVHVLSKMNLTLYHEEKYCDPSVISSPKKVVLVFKTVLNRANALTDVKS